MYYCLILYVYIFANFICTVLYLQPPKEIPIFNQGLCVCLCVRECTCDLVYMNARVCVCVCACVRVCEIIMCLVAHIVTHTNCVTLFLLCSCS